MSLLMRLFRSQLGTYAVFAALLAALLVLRPPFGSAIFWTLAIPAALLALVYIAQGQREAAQVRSAWTHWNNRLDSLVASRDVEDDGHLFEQFDAAEWECIFTALENMPSDSRSLRSAIRTVDPDFFESP
jgi:hypothetical protein